MTGRDTATDAVTAWQAATETQRRAIAEVSPDLAHALTALTRPGPTDDAGQLRPDYWPAEVPAGTQPFEDLSPTGLLWLINRTVFHPRGYALSLVLSHGGAIGWHLEGDGTEAWTFSSAVNEDRHLANANMLLAPRTPAASGD